MTGFTSRSFEHNDWQDRHNGQLAIRGQAERARQILHQTVLWWDASGCNLR
jgi:hypothetical protein